MDYFKKSYPTEPRGRVAHHINTMVLMICGLIGSGRSHLSAIAGHAPSQCKTESQIKQFSRWIQNDNIDVEIYYLPYLKFILAGLMQKTLVLAIDGSSIGQGCVTLMLSVIYRGRALPLVWIVKAGKKGHFPQSFHTKLLKSLSSVIPDDADVVIVGDGEFDGSDFLAMIRKFGWSYVCRTAKNAVLYEAGEDFHMRDICPKRGECQQIDNISLAPDAIDQMQAIAWWGRQYKDPIYLLTNLAIMEEACFFYRQRFRIETFFSDQKSRGFNLHRSHVSDPERLSRLMMISCLAYIWVVFLGAFALETDWHKRIHRTDRCDLGLFQLGRRLLDYFLKNSIDLPTFEFELPLPVK